MAMDLPAYEPTSEADALEHIHMILGDDVDGLFSGDLDAAIATMQRTCAQWAATAPASSPAPAAAA